MSVLYLALTFRNVFLLSLDMWRQGFAFQCAKISHPVEQLLDNCVRRYGIYKPAFFLLWNMQLAIYRTYTSSTRKSTLWYLSIRRSIISCSRDVFRFSHRCIIRLALARQFNLWYSGKECPNQSGRPIGSYVALGDSFPAGNGADDQYPGAGSDTCKRTMGSYFVQLDQDPNVVNINNARY